MCKECTWEWRDTSHSEVVLHRCDCGQNLWAIGAKQPLKNKLIFRCASCDTLFEKKLGMS